MKKTYNQPQSQVMQFVAQSYLLDVSSNIINGTKEADPSQQMRASQRYLV